MNYDIIGEVSHVTKSFGEVVALSDISFAIERERIIGFLGPNGAGKTTSIKLLLGLSKPQTGFVNLYGVNPFINTEVKRLVGYIPEEVTFPSWITPRTYLQYLNQFQMSYESAKKRTEEVLKEVDLLNVAKKPVRQFSKGMKQRFKIALALGTQPALIIGDEPFNGLDPVVRANMFDLISKYNQEYGTTFLISSHILFEVEHLADRIILVYKGRSIAQGSPPRIRKLIVDQPHQIKIVTDQHKSLATALINASDVLAVNSVTFAKNSFTTATDVLVSTLNPNVFYQNFNEIIATSNIYIYEFGPMEDGLENLFKSLTTG